MKNVFFLFVLLLTIAACAPYEADDIALPELPPPPPFSIEFLSGDSNRLIVTDLSSGNFDRLWDFPAGIPAKSKHPVDTVFYPKAGDYLITLYAAIEGGGGTAQLTKVVSIPKDATGQCDPQIGLLTGDCETPGKCWTLSTAAGAVRVGPTAGSSEWYTSPVNGLQAAQYDDHFCFYFDGSHFQYVNNGGTVDPFNGYAVVPFDAPTNLSWFISKGTGQNGTDQIILPTGAFLGVLDSGPVYDIISLSATKLVLRSKIVNTDGWFELTFDAN